MTFSSSWFIFRPWRERFTAIPVPSAFASPHRKENMRRGRQGGPGGGAFVAVAVGGGDGEVAAAHPGGDGGVDVGGVPDAGGHDVAGVGGVDGQGVGGVDHVGGRIHGVVVRGGSPGQAGVAGGQGAGGEAVRGGGGDVVQPGHGGLQGGGGVEAGLEQVVQALGVVHQVLHAVVCLSGQAVGAAEVELAFYLVQRPVALGGVEEVDAQAGDDVAAGGLFLPVEGKGVEVVAAEVEHGVYLVLYALGQPALHVLVHAVEGVPPLGGVSGHVAVFAHGAGAYFDPGLQSLHTIIYMPQDFRQVVAPPLGQVAPLCVAAELGAVGEVACAVGVAQVVQVYAVHVVARHHFADEAHQVFLGLGVAGVEEVLAVVGHADFGLPAGDGPPAQLPGVAAAAQGDGHHPGVALHAALVALFHGKGQGVVARVGVFAAGQYGVEGLDVRAVEHVAAGARLEQYGVEVGLLQAVQYFGQFFLLPAYGLGRGGAGARPVQPVDGGYPGGAHFLFGLGKEKGWQEGGCQQEGDGVFLHYWCILRRR